MGRHRAPDPDDSEDEPFDSDGFETEQFGAGTPVYREDHPAAGYNYAAEYASRYPDEHPEQPAPGGFASETYQPGDHDTDPYGESRFGTDDYDDDTYDDDYADDGVEDPFGYVPSASSGAEPPASPQTSGGHRTDVEWTGSHRTVAPGRRGVSVGVIVALATVVVVVAGFIMWRFFGGVLSDRSDVAAGRCLQGDANVAVMADSAIAEQLEQAASKFNETAGPVGDHCIVVSVTAAAPGAVVSGLAEEWPQDLGEKPALWIPANSVSEARLQAAAGPQSVSNSKSLVSSPVLLAMHPDLKPALADQTWATLPNLQSDPAALDNLERPGWGSLRLALPSEDNSGAAELAAEAVAAAAAPPGAPATAGAGAAARLRADAPELSDDTLDAAMTALQESSDPAAAPVHAVVTTEQQLIQRAKDISDAADVLTSWIPPGAVAVADFPAVLLAGDWLSDEQAAAASEFERFLRRPEQLTALSDAGFRVAGGDPPTSAVTTAAPVEQTLSVGDDAARLELAEALSAPAAGTGPAVSIMLDRSLNLGASVPAINARLAALPPTSAVGLTTFDGTAGNTVVNLGALSDDISGQSRRDLLTSTLNGVSQAGGAVSFTTLRNVYADALTNFKPGQPNSVLVITSGPHTDQSLGAQGLQDLIRDSFDPARPVAVDVINVGADPDRPTWESVAQISSGTYQNVPASDSPEFAAAVNALLG